MTTFEQFVWGEEEGKRVSVCDFPFTKETKNGAKNDIIQSPGQYGPIPMLRRKKTETQGRLGRGIACRFWMT